MTTLKTVVTQKMAINACLLLICLVIIFCLCKRGQMLPVSALCCSRPLFRSNNLSPLLNTKATLGARLLVPWWPAPFICFGAALERTMELSSKIDLIEKRRCLGLQRKNAAIKRKVSAVILSIKGGLTGWVMSGKPSVRERQADTGTVWPCSVDDTDIE